jgi:hypothetical protein
MARAIVHGDARHRLRGRTHGPWPRSGSSRSSRIRDGARSMTCGGAWGCRSRCDRACGAPTDPEVCAPWSVAQRQTALQATDDARLLGPDSLLADRQAVRADHADDLAVLCVQLPVERRRRVQMRCGSVAARAGRGGPRWSVAGGAVPRARLSQIGPADYEPAVADLSAHPTVRSTASRRGPLRRPW